jgi:hypothetical protein
MEVMVAVHFTSRSCVSHEPSEVQSASGQLQGMACHSAIVEVKSECLCPFPRFDSEGVVRVTTKFTLRKRTLSPVGLVLEASLIRSFLLFVDDSLQLATGGYTPIQSNLLPSSSPITITPALSFLKVPMGHPEQVIRKLYCNPNIYIKWIFDHGSWWWSSSFFMYLQYCNTDLLYMCRCVAVNKTQGGPRAQEGTRTTGSTRALIQRHLKAADWGAKKMLGFNNPTPNQLS